MHALTIRVGFGALLLVVGGLGVANGIIMYHMKRVTAGSVLAYTYMGSLAVRALPACQLVAFCFLTAVYRPERDPQLLALFFMTSGCCPTSDRWAATRPLVARS